MKKTNKIIEYNPSYEFCFTEEKIKIEHPLSNYYTKLDDLSINLYINLKWIKWGYYFFKSIEKKRMKDWVWIRIGLDSNWLGFLMELCGPVRALLMYILYLCMYTHSDPEIRFFSNGHPIDVVS